MKRLEIEIDGQICDLPQDNIDLQLNYVNPCADGFGTIAGNSSERSFTIPATKANNAIFENWYLPYQNNAASAANEKDCQIRVNGLQLLSGKAQLEKVTTRGGLYRYKGGNYDVAFFGTNADWFDQLKDLELGRDLDWSSEQHTLDYATILAAYNNAPTDVYAYCIAKTKAWSNIVASQTYVDVYESTPVLFISDILTKIFNSIGYTLPSGFFSNSVNQRYVLAVPLSEKYPQEFSEDYLNIRAEKTVPQIINGSTLPEGVDFTTQTQAPAVGPNPFTLSVGGSVISGVGNVGRYTAPYAGYYNIRMTVRVDNITTTTDFGFGFLGLSLGIVPALSLSLTPANNGDTFFLEQTVELDAGDIIEFYAKVEAGSKTVDITFASVEITGEAKIEAGSLIDFKYLLQDWKITDFIKGCVAAFNLCFETDVDLKTVTIDAKEDYLQYDRAGASVSVLSGFHFLSTTDITQKLDLEKEGEVKAINETSERQEYQWRQDGADKTAEAINENETLPFDAARYTMPLNRFKADTEVNENPFFAPSIMYADEAIRTDISFYTPLLPLLYPENIRENTTETENDTKFEPRILWFGGQRGNDVDGSFNLIDSSTSLTSKEVLPACFFVNYNDTTGQDVSLNWSDLEINGNTVQGHMRRFYLRDLARMREGKEVEAFIYWNSLDILNLSFRPKILIDNYAYILKKIEAYSPLINTSSKTLLVPDTDAAQIDVNAITNTVAIGFLASYQEPE